MGVLISSTENLPIISYETQTNLDSVYGRISYKAYPDGITMEISISIYLSRDKFLVDEKVSTSVHDGNFFVEIDPLTQTQSLSEALNYTISHFQVLGYQCQIHQIV
jgi:hypothetical protein